MVLINQKNCNNTTKNLGVPDCVINNGRITGMIAVAPDWTIDTTTDDTGREQYQRGCCRESRIGTT